MIGKKLKNFKQTLGSEVVGCSTGLVFRGVPLTGKIGVWYTEFRTEMFWTKGNTQNIGNQLTNQTTVSYMQHLFQNRNVPHKFTCKSSIITAAHDKS